MKKLIIKRDTPNVHGNCGIVYFLSDYMAVKTINHDSGVSVDLEHEFHIQNEIYREREKLMVTNPVPVPFGIEDVYFSDHRESGILMERINGFDLRNSPSFWKKYFWMRKAKKLEKNIENSLDIIVTASYGLYPRNVMFDEKTQDIKLIDFQDWAHTP